MEEADGRWRAVVPVPTFTQYREVDGVGKWLASAASHERVIRLATRKRGRTGENESCCSSMLSLLGRLILIGYRCRNHLRAGAAKEARV